MSIRTRVTLVFASAMAMLLVGLGLFIYLRFESQLNAAIDQGLRSRADEVTALVQESDSGLSASRSSALAERGESFAQILTPAGRVFDATPQLDGQVVLNASERARAADGPILVERSGLPGLDGTARLLASPVRAQDQVLIVIVGSSLEDRDGALEDLTALLLIGGLVALALASMVGYAAIGAALRPVESMRRQASAISAEEPQERLSLPKAEDELHRLGQTLNAMLGRLEAAIERERAFVDDASHELRTPLALHKTELEYAFRYAETPEEFRGSIASAIEEADRLIQIAEDMLVVARSEKGKLALDTGRLEVPEVLEDVRERFATRAEAADRRLEVEYADPPKPEADRLRIEQALTNMVDNSLRHGEGTVLISAAAEHGNVRLAVRDEGPGFPEEFLPRAFVRFSRHDTARARGGTGLGLAIVEAIAAAHGGTAGARNLPAGGAEVWMRLPSPS